MKRSEMLQAKLNDLLDKVAAINAVCDKESREPSAEEQTDINAAIGDDGQGGEAATLRKQITQAANFEAELDRQKAARNIPGVQFEQSTASNVGQTRIDIPLRQRRYQAHFIKGESRQERDKIAYAAGSWFAAVRYGHEGSKRWCQEHGYDFRAATTEGFDTKAGVLVPEEFDAAIIALMNDYGIARRELEVVPMSSDTRVVPRRTSGLTAYPVGEAATITASDVSYDSVRLIARKWGVIARYSSEIAEDAIINIGDNFVMEAAYALAYAEDICAFNGDGTSTYNGNVGFKNAMNAGAKYTAATTHTAYSTLTMADFTGMAAKLPSYAYRAGGPKWYIHRAGWWSSMMGLAAAAGGNTVADIQNGGGPQFLGYPVVFVECMNNTLSAQTSTDGLCYFGNPRMGAKFGDRRGIAVSTSPDVYFTTDELAVKVTERFDVNVHDKGDSTLSGAMVMLSTPSS